jgi:hypothetical protein
MGLNIKLFYEDKRKVYATSAAAGSAGAGVLEEGAEVPGAGVKGVGTGKIRDMSRGAYSFAFLKNSFISAGGDGV